MTGYYWVGDRRVRSAIALALPEAPGGDDLRVAIEIGPPEAAGTIVDVPGVGRAWLRRDGAGARARIEASESAPELALLGFVQGVALPAALQLTGDWHIHAASVVIDGGAVALIGEPGTGKSVLGAALARGGCAFFADDGLVIAGGDAPRAILGSPHLRLHDDVARALDIDVASAVRCPSSDKWIVAPRDAGIAVEQGAVPLRALVRLARVTGGRARFSAVKPSAAAVELLAAEFHPSPDERPADDERARFETAVALARRVPMRAMEVPDDLDALAGAAAALIDDLREVIR